MSPPLPELIWRPPPDLVGKMPMDIHRAQINKKFSQSLKKTQELHSWSVANQQPFWLDLYSYLELIPPLPAGMTRAYDDSRPMSSIPPFFQGLELNYTENVRENARRHPKNVALIGLREGQDLHGPVERGFLASVERESPESQQRAQELLRWERGRGGSVGEQLDRGCGVVSEHCGCWSGLYKHQSRSGCRGTWQSGFVS
jgi:hypothetical protein